MDSSEIRQSLYQSQSDQFLNGTIHHDNFPILPKFSQVLQNSPSSSKNHSNKNKGIAKQLKKKNKKVILPKSISDEKIKIPMGRPHNRTIEADHLAISRSFNDIVYHFSRFLIFLKLKQGTQTSNHSLQLTNHQSALMSQVEYIMSVENFPQFGQEGPAFLLHPSSLHFVLQYRRQKQMKVYYNEQEVKYMLFAFLKKRKMLTSTIYHYVNSYWTDIIFLVGNPEGKQKSQKYQFQLQKSREMDDMLLSRQNKEKYTNGNKNNENSKECESVRSSTQQKRQTSQLQVLKKELAEDESIAAYQIACYLYACSLKFMLTIGKNI